MSVTTLSTRYDAARRRRSRRAQRQRGCVVYIPEPGAFPVWRCE